ncbi:hypothetical protein QBC35DRAFT_485806 [Podospora australis]|uniref:Uncharacterized protein n=1 Tax=Podospora australis TaxID=1536484 RepID=A0AAN7AM43_9PEZI|nr:hypothetical protein QBC35DRAFT_485806 [Podospora australis]
MQLNPRTVGLICCTCITTAVFVLFIIMAVRHPAYRMFDNHPSVNHLAGSMACGLTLLVQCVVLQGWLVRKYKVSQPQMLTVI